MRADKPKGRQAQISRANSAKSNSEKNKKNETGGCKGKFLFLFALLQMYKK